MVEDEAGSAEAADEGEATPRDRRAERQARARKAQMAQAPKKALIWGGIAVLAVGVIWGGAALVQLLPEGEKTVHWHTGFEVWTNGTRMSFTDFAYDLNTMNYGRAHLHVQSEQKDEVVHIEGLSGLNCKTWFEHGLTVDMSDSSMRFDGPPYNRRLVENNETHTWKLYIQHQGDPDWTLVKKMTKYEPRHKDRLLFTYGNETKEQLSSQFDSILPASAIPD